MTNGFTLSGQPLAKVFSVKKPFEETVREILEKHPFKQLLTSHEVAAKVGIGYDRFRGRAASPTLSGNRMMVRLPGDTTKRLVWGSKKTIAELAKQMEQL